MESPEQLTIIEAEKINGNLLVSFSNGIAALYQAQFLWDVREDDGNVVPPYTEPDEEDDGPMLRATE